MFLNLLRAGDMITAHICEARAIIFNNINDACVLPLISLKID